MDEKTFKEILSIFLPDEMLKWFNFKDAERDAVNFRIYLEEKNEVPPLPEEHRKKNVTSKGFKQIIVDDFPIRGRKTQLIILRRIWKIEGVEQLLKRDIPISAPGTKLEQEFADFLKETD